MKNLNTGKKVVLGALSLVILFLIYVACKPNHFSYKRKGELDAPPAIVYPYLISFKKGAEWNPYDKKDPNMKKTYFGVDGQIGSAMEFEGNKDVGSGRLEVVAAFPNHEVKIKLKMTKPVEADNNVYYSLSPSPNGQKTTFTWALEGESGFMGKLISTIIDCEKMIGKDQEEGIKNLQKIINELPKEEKIVKPPKLPPRPTKRAPERPMKHKFIGR